MGSNSLVGKVSTHAHQNVISHVCFHPDGLKPLLSAPNREGFGPKLASLGVKRIRKCVVPTSPKPSASRSAIAVESQYNKTSVWDENPTTKIGVHIEHIHGVLAATSTDH